MMEYKKKYFFVILFTLSLTLLLGTCCTCYASQLTATEIRNILYNTCTNFGLGDNNDTFKNVVNLFDVNALVSASQEYDYLFIMGGIYSNPFGNANQDITFYFSNDSSHKSTVNYIRYKRYIRVRCKSGELTYNADYTPNSEQYMSQNGYNTNSVRFNDLNFYSSTSSDTITVDNGWHPSNIDSGAFVDRYWSFTPSNNNRVYVPSFTTFPDVAMTPISVNESSLGTLIGGLHCDQIRIVRVYYSNGEWIMSKGQTWYQFPKNGTLMNFTGGYAENDWTCPININFGNYANNIIAIQFNSNNDDYQSIRHWFFITNNKTIVSNDNVDISGTITGDYANEYNQQNNTNEIIGATEDSTQEITDTITDDSNVQDTLDNFTNTSGDILNSFGYSPLENPFLIIIRNVLTSIKDVLLGSGNQTLEISWGGRTQYLHSEDFVFPNNALFTLIHLICNGFFIWGLYKYGFKLYQWINMGQMDRLVQHTLDDWDKTFWF